MNRFQMEKVASKMEVLHRKYRETLTVEDNQEFENIIVSLHYLENNRTKCELFEDICRVLSLLGKCAINICGYSLKDFLS